VLRRRLVTICREGWYYVAVLAFIVGGATLRDINLLFVLAGMMMGPLLFNWRLVVLSMRSLEVERELPDYASAGQPFRVEIRGENRRRRLGTWALVVEDTIQPDQASGAARRAKKSVASVMLPYVAASSSERASYRLTLPQRGRYRFGPLRVSTRFPLGLVKASARVSSYRSLVVGPRLGRLLPHWLAMLESREFGRQPTLCRQGPIDGDYYGLREWRSGDSKRWIHWRSTAKIGRLAVREFEHQQNQDLALVLDLWTPPEPTDEERARVELAVSLAATIVDDQARRGGNRLLVATAARPRGRWSAAASGMFARQIHELLAAIEPIDEDQLEGIVGSILPDLSPGVRLAVISTRASRRDELIRTAAQAQRPRQRRALTRILWLDVGDPDLRRVFAAEGV
jgi:uncharacterized protein (DUF58 family)